MQGFTYSLRTLVLPFIWIFHPQLLLLDVRSWLELVVVVIGCTVASLLFAALTMGWLRVRTKWWEAALLALAVFTLFRPDFFMDRLYPEFRTEPPARLFAIAGRLPDDERLVLQIAGTNLEGEEIRKTVAVQLRERGPAPADDAAAAALGRKRVAEAGLTVSVLSETAQVTNVKFGSRAKKAGFEQGFDIVAVLVPSGRPSPNWFYLPAFVLIAIVWISQGRRLRAAAA